MKGKLHDRRVDAAHQRRFLIIPEQEEGGLISIGKYRIQDPGLFR